MNDHQSKQQSIAARIAADRFARGVRWCVFALVLLLVVAPMVYRAWRSTGDALVTLVVGALVSWLAWGIAPSGPSLSRLSDEVDSGAHD